MPGPLRAGLVGAGPWGRNYIRTIAGLPALTLARVASRNSQTKHLVPPGCTVSADWREVVGAADVDAVIVATPPATHAGIVLAAIDAGRPVLVEKPMTLDIGSAGQIVAAAERSAILVMVDHVHLFHPAFRELKHVVAEQGPVRAIRARAGGHGPYRPDLGVLWDWGPHDVAMCMDLLGAEPVAVNAQMLERRRMGDAFGERLQMMLRFPGEVSAEIRLSTLDDRHRSFEVELDSRVLRYDASPPAAPEDLPLARALAEFAQAIRAGATTPKSVELGAAVVRTLAHCEAHLGANA